MNIGHAIARAYAEFPGAVAAALTARIAANLPLPYRTGDYLKDAPLIDRGPVAEAALDPLTPELRLNAAAAVIGTVTVSALFDQLFAVDDQLRTLDQYDQQLSNAYSRLKDTISATRQEVFVPVLVRRAQLEDPRHNRGRQRDNAA
jgi:hypothetical protein